MGYMKTAARLRQAWEGAYYGSLFERLVKEAEYLCFLTKSHGEKLHQVAETAAEVYPEVKRLRLTANLKQDKHHHYGHMYTTRERRLLNVLHLTPKQRAKLKRKYSLREHKDIDRLYGYRIS